ncbi:hypothetical protein [Haloplanus halophilus]|uniref:hypothetical protein n=1 Tax=Haloplanus halophilus TaxID=2949993 RepID=UPI00203E40CC|nr:hypothetical protein [Haloplanus sp. GDY1]
MNVEELRSVQRTERQKDSLQHLRDSFYRDVADYVAERKAERERVAEEADDPFSSPEVSRLTDEIETAEEVVESIYERRIGKIVKRATFAAAGMATEDEGLTSEERDLFEDLVARIETNRETVLDTLAGDVETDDADDASDAGPAPGAADPAPDPEPASSATDPTPPPEADDPAADPTPPPEADDPAANPTPPPEADDPAADPGPAPDPDDLLAEAMGGDGSRDGAGAGSGSPAATSADGAARSDEDGPEVEAPTPGGADGTEPTPDGGEAADTDRTTLRITRDVGEIFGVDEREYDLASEDVVTLPTPNAEPLLDRDAAERLD